MSSTIGDLRPERVQPYLRYLTTAIIKDSKNKGSLRKNIWLYLMDHFGGDVDYQEFLVAIRRFMNDGKMYSKEGEFTMHPEVIREFYSKSTPVKSRPPLDDELLKAVTPHKVPALSQGVKASGKKKESPRQSKI